jgi:hypothetical protein
VCFVGEWFILRNLHRERRCRTDFEVFRSFEPTPLKWPRQQFLPS